MAEQAGGGGQSGDMDVEVKMKGKMNNVEDVSSVLKKGGGGAGGGAGGQPGAGGGGAGKRPGAGGRSAG